MSEQNGSNPGESAPSSRRRIRASELAARRRLRAQAERAGVEAHGLAQVVRAPRPDSLAAREDEISEVLDWYIKGFTRPEDLAKLTRFQPADLKRRLIPACLRRLAAGQAPDAVRAKAQLAIEREMGLLRFGWNEMLRAGKPGLKVSWAQIIANCHREIGKLQGLYSTQRDQQVYLIAINRFISGVSEMVASTNDPRLLADLEGLMTQFLAAKALPLPDAPIDAEFTEVAPE